MNQVRIPVDFIEFDEDGKVLRVVRKGQEVLTVALPMRIRTVTDDVKESSMAISITPDRLGTIPPTFRLGTDAKTIKKRVKS